MSSLENALKKIDWDFPNSNTNGNINSIHPYPAKFISEIPRTLIEIIGLPKNTWVFDPFCGSGSTLVEAQLAGIPSIGIDLNPIACLITQVKTEPLGEGFLGWAKKVVDKAKKNKEVVIPEIPNLDHWFKKEIQKIVSQLSMQIDAVPDNAIRNALKISLSSILVRISNQESDTRYAAIDKKLDNGKIYDLFLESQKELIKPNQNISQKQILQKLFAKTSSK